MTAYISLWVTKPLEVYRLPASKIRLLRYAAISVEASSRQTGQGYPIPHRQPLGLTG